MSVYAEPITELITRLAYHAAPSTTGRLLSGFKWHPGPVGQATGHTDFPSVALFVPTFVEEYRAGRNGWGTLLVKLAVSTLREAGIPALMDAVSVVINAIETNVAGKVDPCLKGTLLSPLEVSSNNGFQDDLAVSCELIIVMKPKPFERASR